MATGTTAVAAADAPDRGCASPSPEGVAEVESLVTLTALLQLCRDEHAVLGERVNDPVGPGDQLAEILADVRAVLPVASSVAVLNPEVGCALAGALTASVRVPAVLVAQALAEVIDERYAHSFAGSFIRRSPYRPGVGDPIPLDSPDLRVRLADERVRAGVDVIVEIRAMAASSRIIDEQSVNHTRATTG